MKTYFIEPEVKLIQFEAKDVLTDSNTIVPTEDETPIIVG